MRPERHTFFPFLVFLLINSSFARFVVEKNSLSVTSPEKIKGTHDSAIWNFGIPQYGGSIVGTVVYPKDNRKGCKGFDEDGISFKARPGSLPVFLLVDRGDCYFWIKVWRAQNAGAVAVLIADDVEEPLIIMDNPEEEFPSADSAYYIQNISIPSALIERNFGEKLKDSLKNGEMVNVNLDWRKAVSHPDDRVEYELWTNSNDRCGYNCDMLMESVKDFRGAARFVVEKNSLSVMSPEKIMGTHDSAIANFGIPQYGGSMEGTVVYPKDNRRGCKGFDEVGISFKAKPGSLPAFVLVDRGDCFFALKVWNAQNAGAAAVLVADDIEEALIAMDTPEEEASPAKYIQNITIPSALIEKFFAEKLKDSLKNGEMVNVNLDWREAVPHPDDRVEYELWTNSNDECGYKCEMLMEFVKDFKGAAQILEKGGFTQFTPHYITWYCPQALVSKQCKSQCINYGRYCASDPEQDFSTGYDGKDVVIENLRQLCVFKVASESGKSWAWWDYVTDFQIRCPMKDKKYNKDCAESVIKSLGLDLKKIEKCIGDPEADSVNPVLEEEQHAQIGKGSRGDVTILPTLVVNNRQYRGKLEKGAVLKAICAGFEETTEPAVCLSDDVETNECLDNNGGCWEDKAANVTACKDTFRGKVCKCPLVDGVQFKGDGYTSCQAELHLVYQLEGRASLFFSLIRRIEARLRIMQKIILPRLKLFLAF